MYISKSPSSKMYLKQRLYLFKMSEGSNLIQHVNQFYHITADLERVGVTVEDKAMIMLCSLTPEYETLVTALLANKETIIMQSATDSLLGHHNRHQQHGSRVNSQGDGLYVRFNQGNGGQKNKGKQGDNMKKKAVSYKCQKIGHYKRDYPMNKKQNGGGESSNTANVVQQEGTITVEFDMLAVTTSNHTDSWILDTGCSFHMTSNKEWFETYEVGNFGTVKLADNISCSIIGVNQIKF
ncbi:Retrovirus-related Pol polyprotein from transposon TNT 1-94 [Cardamine amara subsp. amara]|uniref:Retrovirus-related Pol polyprotein from transposon TNT 1-94 n=1 Tax=Cardamine amara subsp. amara TaxID=228776 RepID=A0ABD1BYX9_CARAN